MSLNVYWSWFFEAFEIIQFTLQNHMLVYREQVTTLTVFVLQHKSSMLYSRWCFRCGDVSSPHLTSQNLSSSSILLCLTSLLWASNACCSLNRPAASMFLLSGRKIGLDTNVGLLEQSTVIIQKAYPNNMIQKQAYVRQSANRVK